MPDRPTARSASRATRLAVLFTTALFAVSAWAGPIRSGMQVTVNSDDSVTITSMGSATFPGSVGSASGSPFPYVGGWGHSSGSTLWNDTNNNDTLRFDAAGANILNSGGIANSNGNIVSDNLVLNGSTVLGAALRASNGVGTSAFTSTVSTNTTSSINFTVSGTVTVAPPAGAGVDISVTVAENTDPVTAGSGVGNLVHTITATNTSTNPATGVAVDFSQVLPAAGVAVDSTVPSGTGSVAGSTWTIGNLAASASETLTITMTVDAAATGTVTTNGSLAAVNETDTDAGNDAGSEGTTIATSADVSVSKTQLTANPVAGGQVVYRLDIGNAGPSDAQAVSLDETPPAGYAFVAATAPCGAGFPCALGDITAGGNSVVDVTYAIAPNLGGQMVTNSASASSTTSDPDGANNSDSVMTAIGAEADLALTKSGPADAIAGNQMTYTVQVTNNGPSDATAVSIADNLPGGVTLVSTTGCAEDPTGVPTCSVGTVPAGGSASVSITVDIDPTTTGAIVNSATVSSATPDPVGGNETDSATTNVTAEADLAISKTGPATAIAGTQVTYTLQVTNNGPSDASAISVADATPAGYTFASATAPCAAGFPCDIGGLAPGASTSVDVTFDIDPTTTGAIVNTATVTSPITDPNSANDSSSVTTDVSAETDLAISKTGPATATAGAQVTYTIQVTNEGPSDAPSVSVDDPAPAGTSFASATAPCAGGFPCDLGGLAPTGSIAFDVTFAIDPATIGDITNTATVSATTTDPNAANDSASATTTVGAEADLALTKTTSTPFVGLGDQVVYELVVDNAGPSDATNVVITDTLPAGQVLVDTTGCAEDPTGVPTCTVGTVAAGASALVTIVTEVTAASGFQLNTASVTSDVTDGAVANNASSAGVSIAVVVPALNRWALMLLALMLAIVGWIGLRRAI